MDTDPHALASAGPADEPPVDDPTSPPPGAPPRMPDRGSLTTTFASAIGSSMLGLEQALRSQPPAQVLAWEHRPVRGSVAGGGGIALEFPDDDPDPEVDAAEERPRQSESSSACR